MAHSIEIEKTVAFHDLDPMGIVWHGNYLKFLDQARFALFDSVGVDLYRYMREQHYAFPITRTSIKHICPLGPRDIFTVKATIAEARFKIAIDFEIRRQPDRTLCVRARGEQLAVRFPAMELEYEIPPDIRKAFGYAP